MFNERTSRKYFVPGRQAGKGFTPPMDTERKPFKNLTAEAQSTLRENLLCPIGRRRLGNNPSFKKAMFLFVVVSRQTKKSISLRSLRLCGEMFDSSSALICENLRLISESFASSPEPFFLGFGNPKFNRKFNRPS